MPAEGVQATAPVQPSETDWVFLRLPEARLDIRALADWVGLNAPML